jgi:hypothetical protein
MRYILKAESYDRRGARGKSYCIIAGSAVMVYLVSAHLILNLVKLLKKTLFIFQSKSKNSKNIANLSSQQQSQAKLISGRRLLHDSLHGLN